jgi:hypothetical protein
MNSGQSGNQTVTQQNIPDWALDYAQNTLDMTKYYTNNQDYRPSTLDRDYSGIRGYNSQGRPNSQVGQSGLNPMPVQPVPPLGPLNPDNLIPKLPLLNLSTAQPGSPFGAPSPDNLIPKLPLLNPMPVQPMPAPGGRTAIRVDDPSQPANQNSEIGGSPSPSNTSNSGYQGVIGEQGSNITNTPDPTQKTNNNSSPSDSRPVVTNTPSRNDNTNNQTTLPAGMSQEEVQALIDKQLQQFDANTITPDEMPTPFQAYDRQRFAAPSDRTLQGETLLANRVNGTNPFAEAQAAARGASSYQSGFSPASLNLQGPTANSYNNVLSGLGNVNANLRSAQYGNANQGLLGAQDYGTGQSFQESVQNFMNPYTDQVVNSSLKDINRARQMADLSTMGGAAKSGAFGGSREALMRAENTRNALDQAASTAGQLRSQGFNTAANLAQQEKLQRLGLTAADRQNVRGYQSAGNLQGQSLTAKDLQDVRGLESQGALAAQGLDAQGALTAQGLGAQSDRDVMSLQQQLQRQGNQLAVEQARLAEQFSQGAGALNLQGAGALGNLAQMQTADERQRIADLLASGGAGDARNQQDLDFIFSEFNRELDYPGKQIDLRNAAISPATGSIVTTTQPRYSSGGLPQAAGAGLATYGALAGIPAAAPYALPAALAMGLLNY